MSAIDTVRQGGSLPFVFDLNGEDISDWSCTILVKALPDGPALIEREITPEGRTWPGYLTGTETLGLPVSTDTPLFLIANLVNSSTDQADQLVERFHLAASWA